MVYVCKHIAHDAGTNRGGCIFGKEKIADLGMSSIWCSSWMLISSFNKMAHVHGLAGDVVVIFTFFQQQPGVSSVDMT